MPSRNAVTFSGKVVAGLARAAASVHSASSSARASKSRAISSSASRGGAPQRRQARAVEDLVRVGVADAAEEPGIGERPLERVVLAQERSAERGEVASSTSSPPGSSAASAAAPRTRRNEARRVVPASVSQSEPVGKSNTASAARRPGRSGFGGASKTGRPPSGGRPRTGSPRVAGPAACRDARGRSPVSRRPHPASG